MELKGERIKLRTLKPGDEIDIYRNIQDQKIALYMPIIPWPYTQVDAKYYVYEKALKGDSIVFGIELDDEIIGTIALTQIAQEAMNAEIGYWIGVKFRRQGILTEAIKLVLDYAFKELNLVKIYGRVLSPNNASQSALSKFGFQIEGRQMQQVRRFGVWMDVVWFGLFNEDYYKQ
ncbi:MAG: GNAT family N-acetyltransferase [Candidatus Altimarinota bacterium]